MTKGKEKVEAVLVTGFGSYLARTLTRQVLTDRPSATVYLLAPQDRQVDAHNFVQSLRPAHRVRCQVLEGSVTHMNLGLSSDLYRRLTRELTEIHHAAELPQRKAVGQYLYKYNVEGTREVLELAGESASVGRFCHWSTVQVSGNRSGVVMEDELECNQRFLSDYQRSKFEAERLVRRWARRLPVSIFRPGIVTAHSRTGEMDPAEPAFKLMKLIMDSSVAGGVPLPGSGQAPLHLVPVDFVGRAACHLSALPQARNKTFHLVDPSPLSGKRVCELVARKAHRRPPKQILPAAVARLLLRVPAVARWAESLPSAVVDLYDNMTFYNCSNTLELLDRTEIRCPPLDDYVGLLVRFIRETQDVQKRSATDDVVDPLE